MKKVFLSAALALAVAGSWAFYPKTPADASGGYMIIVGSLSFAGFTSKGELTVVDPMGKTTTENIEAHGGSAKKTTESLIVLRQAELKKLNELKLQGWSLVQTTAHTISSPLDIFTTTYVLERR